MGASTGTELLEALRAQPLAFDINDFSMLVAVVRGDEMRGSARNKHGLVWQRQAHQVDAAPVF